MNAYDWQAEVRARIEAHLADGQNPCSTSDDVVLRLIAECDVERARAEAAEAALALPSYRGQEQAAIWFNKRAEAERRAEEAEARATQLAEALREIAALPYERDGLRMHEIARAVLSREGEQ